jgi:hypothetical protein
MDAHPNSRFSHANRDDRLGCVGVASAVAESLTHDIQNFPLFLVRQNVNGAALEIQLYG